MVPGGLCRVSVSEWREEHALKFHATVNLRTTRLDTGTLFVVHARYTLPGREYTLINGTIASGIHSGRELTYVEGDVQLRMISRISGVS